MNLNPISFLLKLISSFARPADKGPQQNDNPASTSFASSDHPHVVPMHLVGVKSVEERKAILALEDTFKKLEAFVQSHRKYNLERQQVETIKSALSNPNNLKIAASDPYVQKRIVKINTLLDSNESPNVKRDRLFNIFGHVHCLTSDINGAITGNPLTPPEPLEEPLY